MLYICLPVEVTTSRFVRMTVSHKSSKKRQQIFFQYVSGFACSDERLPAVLEISYHSRCCVFFAFAGITISVVSMSLRSKSLTVVVSLLLLVVFHLLGLTRAADPNYATFFLVGPEPQPIVPEDSEGGRKLRARRSSHSPDFRSPLQNVARDTSWKEDAFGQNEAIPAPVSRSLQGGDCRIENTFLGFNFDDNLVETGSSRAPTNPQGAAGVSRLVAVANSMLEVRRKDGTLVFRNGFQSFFSGFAEAFDTDAAGFFDPKVIYDDHKGRFLIVVLQRRSSPQVSKIWLAVSKSETPDAVDNWHKYFIDAIVPVTGFDTYVDFPGLEVDEEAIYITANNYRYFDNAFVGVRIWLMEKVSDFGGGFYNGVESSVTRINPYQSLNYWAQTMPTQVHGANGVDGSVGTFFSAILSYPNGSVDLQIYTLFNPIRGTFSSTIQTIHLSVTTQGSRMPNAPQLGTTDTISTNDGDILDAVWRENMLWVVFTINPTSGANKDQATAYWVRCRTSGGTVTFEAQGELGGEDIAAGTFTYYPSVAANTNGEVAYGYSASSPTTYVGAYASVGMSEQSYHVKSGLAPYVRDSGRWGFYTSISVDPVDDSFWVFNQYADIVDIGGDGRWGTTWGQLVCKVRFILFVV
jgi:hypothetical protein